MKKAPFILCCLGAAVLAGPIPTADASLYPDTVNAATYGLDNYDSDDATAALQEALNSRADTVIVPHMGTPWNVTPLFLRSNQTVIFEEGVVIQAKAGAFQGGTDQLFQANGVSNVTLDGDTDGNGVNATFRMRKDDYVNYADQSEGRHALNIFGSSNINVHGLNLEDSGGDGIFITGHRPSENIHIDGVVADNNYRQGVSISNARNVLIENSAFNNTGKGAGGTVPRAGIDIEPDAFARGFPKKAIQNIVVRDTTFDGNVGYAIQIFNKTLGPDSPDVSIDFENIEVRGSQGIWVNSHGDDSPEGVISFTDVTVTDSDSPGLHITANSASSTELIFDGLTLDNVANGEFYYGRSIDTEARHPIRLDLTWYGGTLPGETSDFGNITFLNTQIFDDEDRAVLGVEDDDLTALYEIDGEIYVAFADGLDAEARADYAGADLNDVTLEFFNGLAPDSTMMNPEPTTLGLFGAGAMVLMIRRRRSAGQRREA